MFLLYTNISQDQEQALGHNWYSINVLKEGKKKKKLHNKDLKHNQNMYQVSLYRIQFKKIQRGAAGHE